MSMVKKVVLSKGGTTAIALIVLVTLVWVAGPRVGLTDVKLRLIIIGVIISIALIYLLISWIITKRRGSQLQDELQEQDENDHSVEIDALKEKMNEAIASLKTTELGVKYQGSSALYALPWYMIIGPSAAGKSTLLRNSGLNFPHSQSDDIDVRGFGGTRNCDWWFSDEAIILDTAGRYTTEVDDNEEWREFLTLIKKYRKRMPINGVIIALSISDLLTADEEVLNWHVKVIRDRIEELILELGYLFPFYITFTKCDLLSGFQSYFNDLNEEDRNQVWGSVLVELKKGEDPSDLIAAKLDQLYVRLCDLRIHKLSVQRKHEIKAEIYDFPSQFQAASNRLIEFINLLFKDNPYQEMPDFKGVYFTSGAQEGVPLQRIVGNLREAFGYVEQAEKPEESTPQSYFINKLLRDVIFKSPRDIMKSRRHRRIHRLVKTSVVFTSITLVIGSVLLLSTAFTANALLLRSGTSAVESLHDVSKQKNVNYLEYYSALGEVYEHYDLLKKYDEDNPWYASLGVYKGSEQIKPIEGVIITSMEQNFLYSISKLLEKTIKQYGQRWENVASEKEATKLRVGYYNTLKTYLMLTDPIHIDAEEAAPVLNKSWKAIVKFKSKAETSKNLNIIPDAYMKEMVLLYLDHMQLPETSKLHASKWAKNISIIKQAQLHLRTPPNAEVLYTQLKNKGYAKLPAKSFKKLVNVSGNNYLSNELAVPGFYTQEGWESYVSHEIWKLVNSASRGDWVLGTDIKALSNDDKSLNQVDEALLVQLTRDIRYMYFNNYVNVWYKFIKEFRVKRFATISDAANKLLLLSRSDGPIAETFKMIGENINLEEINWDDDGNRIITKLSAEDIKKKKVIQKVYVKELVRPFHDMRRFTDPGEKRTVSELMNQYLLGLSGLQAEMERIRASSEMERESEIFASSMLGGSGGKNEMYKSWITTTGILNGNEVRTRRTIELFFMDSIKNSWKVIMRVAMKEVQYKWENMVIREFEDRIRGKFPFSKNGPDAPIDDVAEFFRPKDGILWSFVNQELAPYLVKRRSSWKERNWLGIGPNFSKSFFAGLKNGHNITSGLFQRDHDEPNLTFSLYPIPISGLDEIILETNGQSFRYRMGPQEWKKFKWPGESEQSGARLIGVSDKRNVRAELEEVGVWGVFHLFDKAKMTRERGTQYNSMWSIDSYNSKPVKIYFKLKADKHNNLFRPGILSNFALPKKISNRKSTDKQTRRN
jgi:type VI secretion system protein ImpL